MTTHGIPASLAPVLEELELEQPTLVTGALLEQVRSRRGIHVPVDELVERLRRHGWLLDLRTRGVWEFAPAARAGAFPSGDPFMELRATLSRRSDLPVVVAEESAAWLHGLAARQPQRHVLAAPPHLELPPALDGFRVVRERAMLAAVEVAGLPVWPIESLLVLIGVRPASYRDWPNVGEWLVEAVGRIDEAAIGNELQGRKRSTWSRVAYLISRGGRDAFGQALLAEAPPGTGPFYLGPRGRRGRYDARYAVIDSALPGQMADR